MAFEKLPDQPFVDRVVDPKILDRLLEWTRTADDKASRFAILALGLSLFWMYYAVLVPITALSRHQTVEADLELLKRLTVRFTDVQTQIRNATRVQSRRISPSNHTIPFFVDVLLPRLVHDPRISISEEERRAAYALRNGLAQLSAQMERYRAYHSLHAAAPRPPAQADAWPARNDDPSDVLSELERAENVMLSLYDLNRQAANSEWLDAVERTLVADGERLRLATTITGSLAPYETLVGTWATPDDTPPLTQYREIASRNGERQPVTLTELRQLQDKLKAVGDEAETDLRIRRLRIPFTDLEVDRHIVLATGPIAVILLYHYLLTYLILARQIEMFILDMWGMPAAAVAARLRPSDALFRSIDDGAAVPRLVRSIRKPVRWLTHGAVPAVPALLVMTAAAVTWHDASASAGVIAIALTVLSGVYALFLAYGLWKLP